jgi:rRNA-processing protein FCF1
MTDDFDYVQEEIKTTYNEQRDHQISDLNTIIIAYRTRVSLLEKQLEEREKVPVPQTVIKQIAELEVRNRKLLEELEYYKKFVPVQVIINRENKKQPTRRGGIR